jgi:DNA ligase-1
MEDPSSMKTRELRQELESFGIETKSFVEKIEFIDALVHARNSNLTVGGSGNTAHDDHPASMGTKALRQELQSCGVDTTTFREKSEFITALVNVRKTKKQDQENTKVPMTTSSFVGGGSKRSYEENSYSASAPPTNNTKNNNFPSSSTHYPLSLGEIRPVSSGSGKDPYKVKLVSIDVLSRPFIISCTCPAYKFSIAKKGIENCTCKHIVTVFGEKLEQDRLRRNSNTNNNAGENVVPPTARSSASTAPPAAKRSKVGASAKGGKESTTSTASASTAIMDENPAIPKKITLAKEWDPKTNPTGYWMSEKLDGMRAFWDGKGTIWSRTGKRVRCPQFFMSGLPKGVELDGELFMGRGRFQNVMSVCRSHGGDSTSGGSAAEAWRNVVFVVFDCPSSNGNIAQRLKVATESLGTNNATFARIHPHKICEGEDMLAMELRCMEEQGGEGLMLRKPDAVWRAGRTTDLLKVKTFLDDEAIVVGHVDGKGKHMGRCGALRCKLKNGKLFSVGSGLKDNEREAGNVPQVGTVITFKYFELTKDGIPRFPTFLRIRPDVEATQFM